VAVNSWDGFTETRSLHDLTPGGQITPTTLAANADDYAPLHWQVSGIVFLSASAPVDITGFDAVQLPQVRRLWNEGSSVITLKNGSAGSVAANRLRLSGDFELEPNEGCTIYYSVVLSRWVLVATSATTGGIGHHWRRRWTYRRPVHHSRDILGPHHRNGHHMPAAAPSHRRRG